MKNFKFVIPSFGEKAKSSMEKLTQALNEIKDKFNTIGDIKNLAVNHRNEVLIPMYFYPYDSNTGDLSADFYKIMTTANKYINNVDTTVIINPSAGAGYVQDLVYVLVLKRLHVSGARALGYVSTVYGARDMATVKDDIDKYYQWYDVDGIFLDEFPYEYNETLFNYYTEISNYIKTKNSNARIYVNSGTTSNYQWFDTDIFDLNCIWETGSYPSVDTVFSYEYKDISKNKKCVLLYNATFDKSKVLELMPYINTWYITPDGAVGNPWDSLSPYLENLYNVLFFFM